MVKQLLESIVEIHFFNTSLDTNLFALNGLLWWIIKQISTVLTLLKQNPSFLNLDSALQRWRESAVH